MTPRQFLENIVRSNVDEFHRHYGDLRRAHNAIGSVDALAAHIYAWFTVNTPAAKSRLQGSCATSSTPTCVRRTTFSAAADGAD